ncbi:MAG: hypothetical protein ACKPCP_16545, partial [Sphaerospermopsis kisseleviana]
LARFSSDQVRLLECFSWLVSAIGFGRPDQKSHPSCLNPSKYEARSERIPCIILVLWFWQILQGFCPSFGLPKIKI